MYLYKLQNFKDCPNRHFQQWLGKAAEVLQKANSEGHDAHWIYQMLKLYKEAEGLGVSYHLGIMESPLGVWHVTMQYGSDGLPNASVTLAVESPGSTMKVIDEMALSEG